MVAKLRTTLFIPFFSIYFSLFSNVNLAVSLPETAQHSPGNVVQFDKVVINIEKLMNSDAVLALSTLTHYENILHTLSLKQQVNYHRLLADIYLLQAQYHLAEKAASDGLELTLRLSSPSVSIAELRYIRGFASESIGNIEAATQDYKNGLELAKSLHDKVVIAKGLINLGAIYYLTDQYENSLTLLNDAYNIAIQTADDELKGSVNSELGILYAYLKINEQSMEYFQQSYQFYKRANKKTKYLEALLNIGMTHLTKEEYQQSITVYKTILEESGISDQNENMYFMYSGLSRAYLKKRQPDPEASYQYLMLSKQYMKSVEQYDVELNYYSHEAFVLFELERFEDVLMSIEKVEKILNERASLSFIQTQKKIKVVNLQSKTYFKLGYYQQAYTIQKKRLALIKALREKQKISSIAEARLALEVKQADLHTKLLEHELTLQEVALFEAEKQQQQQKYYLLYMAVVALIFAWVLIKLIQDQRRLHKILNIDTLTGIANNENILRIAKSLFDNIKFKKSTLSVLIIDIDNFKLVNDKFGRDVGDLALKKMAKLCIKSMAKTDVIGRIGGEEFMVLLPNISHAQALIIAENIRHSIEQYAWNILEHSNMNISVSIGVACSASFNDSELSDIDVLINKANSLLYQAKSQGINKVKG